jgi:mono/diheme cytochrome c family protein
MFVIDGERRVSDLHGGAWTLRADAIIAPRGSAERPFLSRLLGARDVRPLNGHAAFVLEPPNLLLAFDDDRDGTADRTSIVASGLGAGESILLAPDGWLLIGGTASRFRWDGVALVRWADRGEALGHTAITTAGDLIEVRGGEVRVLPGDPLRLPTGALLDEPARIIGVMPTATVALRGAACDPADGRVTSLLGSDATSGFVRQGDSWRWTVTGFAPPTQMTVPEAPGPAELALLVAAPDPTQRSAAVEELIAWPRAESANAAAAPLRALARSHADATVRRQALATLERLGTLTESDVDAARHDASPLVTRWVTALRADPARSLAAALRDPRSALRVVSLLDAAITESGERAADPSARASLVAAARGREALLVERLLAGRSSLGAAWRLDTLLDEALDAAVVAKDPAVARRLIELAAERHAAGDSAVAGQLARAAFAPARPYGRKHSLVSLDREPVGYRALLTSDVGAPFSGVDAWIRWPGRTDVAAPPLATSLEETIELGRQVYTTCLTCHGPAGRGQMGVYPPLAQSEYVTGDPERFARILLHGLKGRVQVGSTEVNGLMPRPAIDSDEELAAVMTYVRQAFGNDAPAVSPSLVRSVREKHRDRTEPWDVKELADLKESESAKPTGQ